MDGFRTKEYASEYAQLNVEAFPNPPAKRLGQICLDRNQGCIQIQCPKFPGHQGERLPCETLRLQPSRAKLAQLCLSDGPRIIPEASIPEPRVEDAVLSLNLPLSPIICEIPTSGLFCSCPPA